SRGRRQLRARGGAGRDRDPRAPARGKNPYAVGTMAIDRHATGLAVVRLSVGVFFLFEGIGKLSWFADPAILARQLDGWLRAVPPASWSHMFLERVAIPGNATFAWLVPLGELSSGVALVAGFWTPLFAFIAFLMALTFQFASGALFKYTIL